MIGISKISDMIRIMVRFDHIASQFRRNAPALLSALLVIYFLSHALNGANSLKALNQLQQDQVFLEQEAIKTSVSRQWLEKRASLLKSHKIDPDLLDELARRNLSVGQADEVLLNM